MTTETYGPAAYRGQALPALPPPIRDKQGLFDTALKWKGKRKQQIYCDAERWSFENSSKLLHFLFILKLCCLMSFFFPWTLKLADIFNSNFLVTT
ncbi:hypothetical protein [Stutzerimonas nitrititolerans]|uniref:hypothetical protein n=1 Tax=Stutzerimonas nitrititolerans TaxID=2482751 RepID=UPI0028A7A0EE|nr:hypothetical protein [Stutzerimonas nitrititolerans]